MSRAFCQRLSWRASVACLVMYGSGVDSRDLPSSIASGSMAVPLVAVFVASGSTDLVSVWVSILGGLDDGIPSGTPGDLAKTSLREISCANYNHDVRAGESTPHFETLEDFLRVNRSTTSSAVRSVPSQQTRSSDEIVRRKSRQPASVLAAGVQASFLAGSAVGWRS